MRYEDWDVLLFPKDSKVPIKEFKTNCHVVHDTEFAYTHRSHGLPTMTCFMPGLSCGTPFNISLHCWKTPDISQFTKSYSKHPELVKFEARVLVDGRLVASSAFNRAGPWPQLINHSFEFTKNGDLEVLKFPTFRSELLRQNYWSPADEIGRIKVVISEGFPRDSLTVPIERVKNIIAFSFQHAPIDILESSGIAWPNPTMWRRGPFTPNMPVPTQQHEDGPDAHLHSPRRRASLMKGTSASSAYSSGGQAMAQAAPSNFLGSMPNTQAFLHRGGAPSGLGRLDSFDNQQRPDATAYIDWTNNFGPVGCAQPTDMAKTSYNPASSRKATNRSKISNSDASMPDFGMSSSSNAFHLSSLQPMSFNPNFDEGDVSALAPKVPTNTPTAMTIMDDLGIDMNKVCSPGNTPPTDEFFHSNANFSSELATSLTHSLLNQPHPLPIQAAAVHAPAHEVKSRKENRLNHEMPGANTPTSEHADMRKVSQSAFGTIGQESGEASTTNSPPGHRTFSGVFSQRSTSVGEFGNELTNMVNSLTQPNVDATSGTSGGNDARLGSSSDKGVKRTRHFTPASAKVIDDEDEPRRSSPRLRLDDSSLSETN
ncbi:hypothetical protein F4778DRAFT_120978 [Xylariomycetidae sp. FL2044]|nr:hypothetical protein F4778DRAFT_120978 [Xylariomycetidae sp. FL2044]